MELPIRAPRDGNVARVNCRAGELVQPGTPLVESHMKPLLHKSRSRIRTARRCRTRRRHRYPRRRSRWSTPLPLRGTTPRSRGVREPEMAAADGDAEAVFAGSRASRGALFGPRPNMTGLERAARPASPKSRSSPPLPRRSVQKNINNVHRDSLAQYAKSRKPRGRQTCAFGATCRRLRLPVRSDVDTARVVEVTEALFAMGVEEVAVSDTIGIAHPDRCMHWFGCSPRQCLCARSRCTFMTHAARAGECVRSSQEGVIVFDSAAGGLAASHTRRRGRNLATEDCSSCSREAISTV